MHITKTERDGVEIYTNGKDSMTLMPGFRVESDMFAYKADVFQSKESAMRFILSWLVPLGMCN